MRVKGFSRHSTAVQKKKKKAPVKGDKLRDRGMRDS